MDIPNAYSFNQLETRKLNKRPSTSMDFTCAGPNTAFGDVFDHEQIFGYQHASSSASRYAQRSPMYRRSISAPHLLIDFNNSFPSYPIFIPEANLLTPINPAFVNVFDRFVWPSSSNSSSNTTSSSSSLIIADLTSDVHDDNRASFSKLHDRTLDVSAPTTSDARSGALPSSASTYSPLSHHLPNLSHHTTPNNVNFTPNKTAGGGLKILHPAPVTKFDVSTFEAQIKELESYTDSLRIEDAFAEGLGLGIDNDRCSSVVGGAGEGQ
ncbi:hypothetical protein M422DRAFT_40032 [Sphaerobolus stellatus SS14]|uniref:Uncharacterized protein n=1 Tax=Sphaerobolus stellatus (strain SS14) TaxID=990650 RepID=A0A0C9UBR3_SPHS4|nr:hypothetical protein M422DRAFT_40032 [Sphaerobolus stellatus SS14]